MTFATLTSESYIPGTVALINSLKANSKIDPLRMTVLIEGDLSDRSLEILKQAKHDIKIIKRTELGQFEMRPDQTPFAARIIPSIQKLTLFLLTIEKSVYFLDSDMICVGDMRQAKSFSHFSSAMVFGISLPNSIEGRPMFSGGAFVFSPSLTLFDEMQKFSLAYKQPLPMGDQSILNAFFYQNGRADDVHLLGIEWEMLKRVHHHHRRVWDSVIDKKIIHFVGKKPWQPQPEPEYRELNSLWKKYHDLH